MGRKPLLGVAGGADPDNLVDLDAKPDDDDDSMHRGIHELPCQRDMEGTSLGGGISSTG
jgi:hypothetical protein